MSKEIEEMAKAMCGNAMPNGNCAFDDDPCSLECVYGCCAERLYQKGYRKQVEGEWVVVYEYNEYRMCKEAKIACNVCGHKPKYEGYLSDMHFCSNCGARMKGADDEN